MVSSIKLGIFRILRLLARSLACWQLYYSYSLTVEHYTIPTSSCTLCYISIVAIQLPHSIFLSSDQPNPSPRGRSRGVCLTIHIPHPSILLPQDYNAQKNRHTPLSRQQPYPLLAASKVSPSKGKLQKLRKINVFRPLTELPSHHHPMSFFSNKYGFCVRMQS